ncbi:MAG: hypothetical protein GY847_34050 [Proteobacteria bacterium]|nr:hypothetical protein [Pseudomonadota bacterium]
MKSNGESSRQNVLPTTFEIFVTSEEPDNPISHCKQAASDSAEKDAVNKEPERVEEKPDIDEVAALEAALCIRCPYTGRIQPPAGLLAAGVEKVDSEVGRDKWQESLDPESADPQEGPSFEIRPKNHRVKPIVIPILMVLGIAMAVAAYASLHSKTEQQLDKNIPFVSQIGPTNTIVKTAVEPELSTAAETEEVEPLQIAAPVQIVGRRVRDTESTNEERPDNVPLEDSEIQTAYDDLMIKIKKTKKRIRRIEFLREAVALYPRGDDAAARLAIMLMESKDSRAEALELAEHAVEINPDNARAWLAIGYVNQLTYNTAKSRDAYKQCALANGPTMYVQECRALLPKIQSLY